MRIVCTAAVFVGAAVSGAHAQDDGLCFDKGSLSYTACEQTESDFGGFYIGATAGFASGSLEGAFDSGAPDTDANFPIFSTDESGAAFGLHVGYMAAVQSNIVVGFELDATSVDLEAKNENIDANPSVTGVESVEGKVNYLASARVRAGYVLGDLMPYVTGGVGLVDYEFDFRDQTTHTAPGNPGVDAVTKEETATVGVFGGGLEYKFSDALIIRAEGLYYAVDDSVELDALEIDDADLGDFGRVSDIYMLRLGTSLQF